MWHRYYGCSLLKKRLGHSVQRKYILVVHLLVVFVNGKKGELQLLDVICDLFSGQVSTHKNHLKNETSCMCVTVCILSIIHTQCQPGNMKN